MSYRLLVCFGMTALTLLTIGTPAQAADAWDYLDSAEHLTEDYELDPDVIRIAFLDDLIYALCEGSSSGQQTVDRVNGGAIIHLPTGQYYGWASPCPKYN